MTSDEPRGIGGWLVLVPVGLIMTAVRSLMAFAQILPLFTGSAWHTLTSPESSAYNSLWAPLLVFEAVGNLVIMAAAIYALALMKRQSPRFVPVMVGYFAVAALFAVIDSMLARLIPEGAGEIGATAASSAGRTIVVAAIWIPYLLVSKRVRNTFSRPADAQPESSGMNSGPG